MRLLDARTSQNKSRPFQVIEPVVSSEIILVGQVGLNIFNPVGVIRVQFSGIFTLQAGVITANTGAFIYVVRGTDFFNDPIVFELFESQTPVAEIGSVKAFNFSGSDFNVPAPANNQLIYTMFVQPLYDSSRIGPESFNAAAYSD